MSDVTQILSQIESGDPSAADRLMPLVYDELRMLAKVNLAQEKPGQTLQATALVHEVYVRLVDVERAQHFNSRGHFFAAAAEAMRRILVENARRKQQSRRGGGHRRVRFDERELYIDLPSDELLALDDALKILEQRDAVAAKLVMLRFFGGLTMAQAAEAVGMPLRTAERNWTYARTWLHREIAD